MLTLFLGKMPARQAECYLRLSAGENLELASLEWPTTASRHHVVLAVLVAIWLGSLTLGFVFGRLDRRRLNRLPLPIRLLSSAILVVCALIWWRWAAIGTPLAPYAAFLFCGMSLSFVGDLIMSGVLPLPNHVLFGMGTFGIAHVVYILGYVRLAAVLGQRSWALPAAAVLAYCALGVPLWWRLVRSPGQPRLVNWASLAYSLVLATMAGLAAGVALQEVSLLPLGLGALLFVVSDLLLGHRLFQGGHFVSIGDCVWMTYILGQLLIVFSTASGLSLVR